MHACGYWSSHLPVCISAKVCLENCYIWTWFQFIWACRWRHIHICTVLGKQALNQVINGCQGDLAKDAEASEPFHWEVPMFYQCLPLLASLVLVVILKLPQCCHALQGLPSSILGPPAFNEILHATTSSLFNWICGGNCSLYRLNCTSLLNWFICNIFIQDTPWQAQLRN